VNKPLPILITFAAIQLFFLACQQNDQTAEAEEDKAFFPIAGNIQAELKEIDSLPIAVMKYTSVENMADRSEASIIAAPAAPKIDTSIAPKDELKAMAGWMINPDISAPEWKGAFREDVFYDKTVNVLTMSYTTNSEKPPVRKIEVRVNPESDKVRSIYVERQDNNNDTLITRKMVWVTGQSLQVITSWNLPGKPETIRTEKYSWGM